MVGEAAKAAPAGQALQGRGWIETHWPERRFPNRADIDAVTGDRADRARPAPTAMRWSPTRRR